MPKKGNSKQPMDLQQRINAFASLGRFLGQLAQPDDSFGSIEANPDTIAGRMATQLQLAKNSNGWFTQDNLQFALTSWSQALTKENLNRWVEQYTINEPTNPKTVAIVMAGNIPLVGFHDFLSVLIIGHKVLAKLSSQDRHLLPIIAQFLRNELPHWEGYIHFSDGKLENFDAVIATGSNNTARYFEYYFGKYPNIIRRNRNSVAVLTGNETEAELTLLADDIFRYFGLGCRNVSKLFLPKGYRFEPFFEAMYSWKEIINNHKYINNYDYNKAVYLMSNISLLDNEFLLLKEDPGYASPISVLFYEYY
ncbi:MAG: acyl-CoA reductase, partial [Flavobacteriaceae bacterium]|nr:acyl-CoA reductase [Flavobacteriaceae bacterium]